MMIFETVIQNLGVLPAWSAASLFIFLRYAFFAGMAWGLVWWLRNRGLGRRRIQGRKIRLSAIRREMRHSAVTAGVYGMVWLLVFWLREMDLVLLYLDPGTYGLWYLPLSFILLVVLHDAYFYWMHRLMHHPLLFGPLHRVHHLSANPTPWASLSFSVGEAVLEIAIVPLLLILLPVHPLVLFLFIQWALVWNVIGHLGYEPFPPGWIDHPLGRWFNTSTHHNMHHQYGRSNYGLYFNWWDRWMKTNHGKYPQRFREITTGGRV